MTSTGAAAGFFQGVDRRGADLERRPDARPRSRPPRTPTSPAPQTGLLGHWGLNEGAGDGRQQHLRHGHRQRHADRRPDVEQRVRRPRHQPRAHGRPSTRPANGATGIATSPVLSVTPDRPRGPAAVGLVLRPHLRQRRVHADRHEHAASPRAARPPKAWTALDPGQRYEWYVTVSDGATTTTAPTWTFTTAAGQPTRCSSAPATSASCTSTGDDATAAILDRRHGRRVHPGRQRLRQRPADRVHQLLHAVLGPALDQEPDPARRPATTTSATAPTTATATSTTSTARARPTARPVPATPASTATTSARRGTSSSSTASAATRASAAPRARPRRPGCAPISRPTAPRT